MKAAWIRHIDGLAEFTLDFSGAEGTLTYIKEPGFGAAEGWRANVSQRLTPDELIEHQERLRGLGINVRALLHRPDLMLEGLQASSKALKLGLDAFAAPKDGWRLAWSFVDAVLEDTLTPSSWAGYGPLPSGIDGLRQTQVVCAIVGSARMGKPVHL